MILERVSCNCDCLPLVDQHEEVINGQKVIVGKSKIIPDEDGFRCTKCGHIVKLMNPYNDDDAWDGVSFRGRNGDLVVTSEILPPMDWKP